MTKENIKLNIKEELKRAEETLKAASILYDNNLINDATSRLYYFLLHNIKALLLTKGLEPKSHEGALRLLGLHFIKTDIFEAKASHIFSKLMKYREEADYNPSYVFTRDDFIDFQKEAQDLAKKIKEYLQKNKYI